MRRQVESVRCRRWCVSLASAIAENAVVFASGHVDLPQMARAGLWLNLMAIVVVALLAYGGTWVAVGG